MPNTLMATSPADALNWLAGILDLSNVRMKLADPDEGKSISDGQLDLAEQEYRRFLALHLASSRSVASLSPVSKTRHSSH